MSRDSAEDCGIAISADTEYLAKQSNPAANSFAFAYTITISNNLAEPVRLLSRHWIITDQNNRVEEVKGKGVLGQQPVILPGESIQYSSGAIIKSETGDMRGSYIMKTASGHVFEAPIPLFILAAPNMIH